MDFADFFFIALLIIAHTFAEKYIQNAIDNKHKEILLHAAQFRLQEGTHPDQLYQALETLTRIENLLRFLFMIFLVIGTAYFPIVNLFGYCVEIATTISFVHFFFFYKKTVKTPVIPGESKLWKEAR